MTEIVIIGGGRTLGKSVLALMLIEELARQGRIAVTEVQPVEMQILGVDECAEIDLNTWRKLRKDEVEASPGPAKEKRCAQWKQERNAHRRYWR